MIEAVARALCRTHARYSPDHKRSDEDVEKFIDWHWNAHTDHAQIAIAAHVAALTAAGYVIRPRVPTNRMWKAGKPYMDSESSNEAFWRALVDSEPFPGEAT